MTSAPSLAVSSDDEPTGLDLLPLPADRSDFDVHRALGDDKVPYMEHYSHFMYNELYTLVFNQDGQQSMIIYTFITSRTLL